MTAPLPSGPTGPAVPALPPSDAGSVRRQIEDIYSTHIALQPMLMHQACLFLKPDSLGPVRTAAERFVEVVGLGPALLEAPLERALLEELCELGRNPMALALLRGGQQKLMALLPLERRSHAAQRLPVLRHWLDALEYRQSQAAIDAARLYLDLCCQDALRLINPDWSANAGITRND